MAGRKRYSYRSLGESAFSPRAKAALILGILSGVVFGILTYVTASGHDSPWVVGTFGVTAFFMAFIGMIEGLESFKDMCRSYSMSKWGTLLSGFMVAVWFLTFCVGLAK